MTGWYHIPWKILNFLIGNGIDGVRQMPTLTTSCPDWLNPLDKASSNKSLLTLVSLIIQTFVYR